ncbi:MAG: hypothetical protein ACI9ES_000558 [Oceanospirillaceae bacterium]|jgi:hypothetical protein
MKKLNKLTKYTPLLFLSVMGTTMATDVSVPLTFTTLPAITIDEIQPLAFGDVLSLTQADTCTMSTALGTELTKAQEGADSTSSTLWSGGGVLVAGLAGELTGPCDSDVDGQVGIYEILSGPDANITVTISNGTATDISFVPAGYVTDLVEGTSFTRETIVFGAANGVTVNSSAALSPFGVAGTNRAVIGGVITNFVALNAGQPYATDFNLNVVYQ